MFVFFVDFFEVLKQRFRNSDSWVVPPKKVSWQSAASFGSKDVKVPILFIGCEWSWLQIEGLWWSNFVGKWGGIFRWVEVSSASFVTRLLRNLQNARVGGNSSWFYRYTCRCRLNTSNFSQHSGTGSFASQKILICQSDPGPMGPMVPIPGLEAGHLTHHHLWHGALDLWWAFSFFGKKKPRWEGNVEPILFADFSVWRFLYCKREMSSHHVNQILVVH